MKMSAKKVTLQATNNFKNGAFLAPNRTIDESPLSNSQAPQKHEQRDPLRAPGQNRRNRETGDQRADEVYGGTEIPKGGASDERPGAGDLEKKRVEKNSSRPADPRNQHEKEGEKERRGLDREFGRE
ncbi:MAG TPA: hypothetical protein VG322_05120 [Candidatus Acidoferrales bacterium]|nr:hypothetical protein [Candidatus Acidoferrales bacterium]